MIIRRKDIEDLRLWLEVVHEDCHGAYILQEKGEPKFSLCSTSRDVATKLILAADKGEKIVIQ